MRLLLSLMAAMLVAATPALAQDRLGKPEVHAVWPGNPPGFGKPAGPEKVSDEGGQTGAYSNISEPRYEVYRPAHPNGAAALLLGGGGYFRIQIGSAKDVAATLAVCPAMAGTPMRRFRMRSARCGCSGQARSAGG